MQPTQQLTEEPIVGGATMQAAASPPPTPTEQPQVLARPQTDVNMLQQLQNASMPTQIPQDVPVSLSAAQTAVPQSAEPAVVNVTQPVSQVQQPILSSAPQQQLPPQQLPPQQSMQQNPVTVTPAAAPVSQLPEPHEIVTEPVVQALSQPLAPANGQVYAEICTQIVVEQREIIGSLAIDQANLVEGLVVNTANDAVTCRIEGDGIAIIDNLISRYQDFFGHAAVEVCREAASQLINKLHQTEIPVSLR